LNLNPSRFGGSVDRDVFAHLIAGNMALAGGLRGHAIFSTSSRSFVNSAMHGAPLSGCCAPGIGNIPRVGLPLCGASFGHGIWAAVSAEGAGSRAQEDDGHCHGWLFLHTSIATH